MYDEEKPYVEGKTPTLTDEVVFKVPHPTVIKRQKTFNRENSISSETPEIKRMNTFVDKLATLPSIEEEPQMRTFFRKTTNLT